jgi:glutathione peroxidase
MSLKKNIRKMMALGFGAAIFSGASAGSKDPTPQKTFFDLKAEAIGGEEVSMDAFRGKVILVVNTASRCGFTKQYNGLQAVYEKYKDQGFVVLGFPSNDFGNQEPGSNAEIKKFCELNFNVNFPMFARNPVSGPDKQEVFQFLTEEAGGSSRKVMWNFEKFLIGRSGELIDRYLSTTSPESRRLTRAIEKALKEKNDSASSTPGVE